MTLSLSLAQWIASLVAGGGIVAAVGVAAVLLARREGHRAAHRALGGLLLVAAAVVLYVLLLYVQPPGEHLGVVFAPLPFTFAIGPLLYAYVRARLGLPPPGAAHAVLPLAQAALLVGVALAPRTLQAAYMARVFAPWWADVQNAVFAVGLAAYLGASWQGVRRSPVRYDWERARAAWLRRLLVGAALAWGGVVGFSLALPALGVRAGLAETLLYAGVVYATALGGLVQAEARVRAPQPPARKEHYGLRPDLLDAHAEALARLVADEKPHLDPGLTLGTLADRLGVTEKVLSYLLNERLGTTYTDYVNRLRVDEAQRRLAAPEAAHLSVLAVGLDAGFASKSTFNRVFKEQTGATPSAWRAARLGAS